MPIMQFNAGSVLFVLDECHDLGILEALPEKEIFTMPLALSKTAMSKTTPAAGSSSSAKSVVSKHSTPSPAGRDDGEASISMQTYSSLDTSATVSLSSINRAVSRHQVGLQKHNSNKKQVSNGSVLYKINLVFDTQTTFLMIPYQYFEKILDDEKRIMKSMADGEFLIS
jgi:hypothetical protein